MTELTFKVAEEGGVTRDFVVRVHEPFRSSSKEKRPWAVRVDVDGRRYVLTGVDPLDADTSFLAMRLIQTLNSRKTRLDT